MGFRAFRVQGLGFRVSGLRGLGCRVWGSGYMEFGADFS